MTRIAGVDGCRAGWFVTDADASLDDIRFFVAPAFATVAECLEDRAVVGVDIPIGLPDRGTRDCDREARRLLAPHRAASVFPAPIRAVLGAPTHAEASDRREAIDGKRMSAQAFNILSKVAEVDRAVRASPETRARIREVHPELAFATLNGGQPLKASKRSGEGFAARFGLLSLHLETASIDRAIDDFPRRDVAKDDVLDAFAVLLVAARINAGRGLRVPAEPECDPHGLDMAIWY